MEHIFYDISKPKCNVNHRWIQPPQIAYFVTTIDKLGNVNVAPVTLGTCVGVSSPHKNKPGAYYFAFSLRLRMETEEVVQITPRDAVHNLEEVPECVVSYMSYDIFEQARVATLPLPKGISELEVAGLTPFPSRKITPPGIKECPVNIETKVISTQVLGSIWKLHVCEVVGVSVDSKFVKQDRELYDGIGVLAIDPLFEVQIKKGNFNVNRLYYGRMDKNKLHREPDDIGSTRYWVGNFEIWMEDEEKRKKITKDECKEILELKDKWMANPNPRTNSQVKEELTQRLKDIVWNRTRYWV